MPTRSEIGCIGKCRLTVGPDITNHIGQILLLLGLAVILSQLACEVTQDGVALRQNLSIELDDREGRRRVLLSDDSLLVLGVFVKAITDVGVGDAGVFPHETDDLATATGGKVQVMDCGLAANGLVCGTGSAVGLGGRHDGFQCFLTTRISRDVLGRMSGEIGWKTFLVTPSREKPRQIPQAGAKTK